jgi:hypothetical protein
MRAHPVTLLPLLLWLLSATAAAATVYKWVDERGVTHYSDQPHPNATTVDVKPAQTVSGPASRSASSANTAVSEEERTYPVCELYRPENDEVFLNTSTVTAKLRLEPTLAPGDQIGIAVDGKRLTNQPRTGTDFVLSGVERGTHTVFAVVANAAGKPLCTTAPVTFHVRQPSVQAPVKAVRPKF